MSAQRVNNLLMLYENDFYALLISNSYLLKLDFFTNDTQALELAEDQTLSGTAKRLMIMNDL